MFIRFIEKINTFYLTICSRQIDMQILYNYKEAWPLKMLNVFFTRKYFDPLFSTFTQISPIS